MMPKPHAKQKPNQYILDFWSVSPENIQPAPLTAWNQVLYCVTLLFWMQDDARWCKVMQVHNISQPKESECSMLSSLRLTEGAGRANEPGGRSPPCSTGSPYHNNCWIHVEYMLNTCWIPDRSRSCEGPKESKQTCANGANACQTDGVVVPKSGHLRWTLARHVIQTGAWAVGNRERLSNMFKCPTWARHCKKASRESLPHI